MADTIRIAQLSDTHFLADGDEPEGGFAYDTNAAFDAVHGHMNGGRGFDMVVVTGDVADHGRAAQYDVAASEFARFDVPVNVGSGNHDLDAAFSANIGRPNVSTSRVVEIGPWAFIFVDSSAGMMRSSDSGLLIDQPGDVRLHSNGSLGAHEAAWIRSRYEATTADHVFIWLHHPPDVTVPMAHDQAYADEWHALLADMPRVRGFGGGHTHVPDHYELLGRPVFVAPSFKNNFDLTARTLLPPGYRTYEFGVDGSVTSEVQLVDDERWPRSPIGRALVSMFEGELTFEEFQAIVDRKAGRPR